MSDSSDEEKLDQDQKDGSVSPRTLLAIQRALAEEEDGAAERRTLISSSPTKLQPKIHRPAPQVVISSSEEETEPDGFNSLQNAKSDLKVNPAGQNLHVKDALLVSSSEDEMEGVIGQRNKALHSAALQHETKKKSEEETKKGQLTEDIRTESRQAEKHEELITESEDPAASNQNTSSTNLSAQLCEKPLTAETEVHPVLLKQRSNNVIEAPEERNGEDVKSEGSEESESEGTGNITHS